MSLDSKNPKIDSIRLALILFLITSLVAVALAVANYYTSPIIEQAAHERLDDSLRELFAEAKSFEPVEDYEDSVSFGTVKVPVKEVYLAKDDAQQVLGFCVRVTPAGYSDIIDMMVALDADGMVVGVQLLSIAETPGIGMKVDTDETFQKRFWGLTDTVKAVKTIPSTGEVQVISGATVSSTAYINGVNAAVELVQNLMLEVLQ